MKRPLEATNSSTTRRWLRLAPVIPILLLLLGYAVLVIAAPIGMDSGVFIYSGQVILAGGAPYIDAWDHKGPLLYLFNAIALWVFGGGVGAVYALEGAMAVASLAVAMRIWYRQAPPLVVAVLGTAYVLSYFSVFQDGNLSETWLAPFSLVAYSLLTRTLLIDRDSTGNASRPFGAAAAIGFAGGVAALTRPNNGLGLLAAALVLAYVHRKHLLVVTGGIAAGGLAIAVPTLGFVYVHGAWDAMLDQYLAFNFAYSQSADVSPLSRVGAGLSLFGRVFVLPLGVLFTAATVAVLSHGRVVGVRWLMPSAVLVMVTAVEFASTLVSGRGYSHYLVVVLPPMALAALPLLVPVGRRLASLHLEKASRGPRIWAWLILGAAVAPLVAGSVGLVGFLNATRSGVNASGSPLNRVVATVGTHLQPGTTILLHGRDTNVLAALNVRNASRFTYFYPLLSSAPGGDRNAEEHTRGVLADPPDVILKGPAACDFGAEVCDSLQPGRYVPEHLRLAELRRFVGMNYARAQSVDGYEIWLRLDNAP